MSEEDTPPARFAGHTYSRTRNVVASKVLDESGDSKTVSVKAAMSISKWGKANYVPVRESLEGASEPKKQRMENKGEDPFSFDTEDKRKLAPVKKHEPVFQEQESYQPTKLPASRIVVKGKGYEEYLKTEKDEDSKSPAFRTYSRISQKKPIIMDQFVEVGRKTPSGQTVFFSEAGHTEHYEGKKEIKGDLDEEDEIFPVQFRRDPLKTYSGEVVTPVDKPDSPPPKKSGYKKKGGPRGRKPLTVSDPELIEEYRRNYAAQLLKGKPDTAVGGLSNSMVVSKQELANEDQGTTVVVVCKPKAQVEKGEIQTRYSSRSSKPKGALVPVTGDAPAAQEAPGDYKNVETMASTQGSTDGTPGWTSILIRNTANSDRPPSMVKSESPAGTRRVTRRSANQSSVESPALSSVLATPSSHGDHQGEVLSVRGGKRYRIFKSRAPHVEGEAKFCISKGDEEEGEEILVSNESELYPSNDDDDAAQASSVDDTTIIVQIEEQLKDESDITPEMLEEIHSDSAIANVPEEDCEDVSLGKHAVDPSEAREILAARLRNIDKTNDWDSVGEPDNASECSENLMPQESPPNSQGISEEGSQGISEEGSQKEGSEVAMAPRKFFKSKKSLSGSSDHQKKIFGNSPQKSPAKAVYNARSWYTQPEADKDKGDGEMGAERRESTEGVVLMKDSGELELTREVHWPERKQDEAYTSLKVNKTHRELYTVVHNVKQTHEVQELGETQDFMDEVDYLLDSLQDTNSTTIRCLSCLKLAGKCISPAFRMHLRAHGTVTKIFSLLHDACTDPCLALSTSTMMFMLSRDRLNMDLDQESLNLMLRLNEVDSGDKAAGIEASILRELGKVKQKVKELLELLQQESHAREIDLGFVSTGNLAMESLLSLTSRRAGEWFKEELRSVGGLDHIVDSVTICENTLPENISQDVKKALPVLRKLDRCLRVLENISYMNSDNQNYLISYKDAALLRACTRTLRLCQQCLPEFKVTESVEQNKLVKDLPGYTIITCMLAVLRVLLNVTHENQLGSLDVSVETSLMETIVRCLTTTQWCVPVELRFDLAVLCLGLLINLVEHREANRQFMMSLQTEVMYTETSQPKTMSAVRAVVALFVQREEAAREMDEDSGSKEAASTETTTSPPDGGEWKDTETGIQWITSNLKKAKEEQERQKKAAAVDASEGESGEAEGNQSILEDEEETFTKALHKAGKHMENSIVASYAGLLLGTTIIDNAEYACSVKKLIPNEDFGPMIKILKKFLNFMSLTTAFGSTDVNGITKVIEVLESV